MDLGLALDHGGRSRLKLEAMVVGTVLVFVMGMVAAAVLAGGRQALDALRSIPLAVLPMLLGLALFNYVLRALRWIVFSRAMRINVPPMSNALYFVAGFAMTTTPGKLGEALRLWLLRRAYGYRYDATAGLLIADRLSDAVSMVALVALTVAWLSDYLWVSLVALAGAGAVTLLFMRPVLLRRVADLGYRVLRRFPRLFVGMRRAIRQLEMLANPRVFAMALLLGALGWLLEGASLWLILHALGIDLPPPTCIFIFSFAMIVGGVSVLPGGLGSTEATMIGLLTLKGVPLQIAIVATAVVRVATLWFAVSLGLLALPVALHQARFVRRARLHAALPASVAVP